MSCLVELGNFVVVDDIVKRILRFLVVWGGEIFEYFKIKFFFCEWIEMKSVIIFVG